MKDIDESLLRPWARSIARTRLGRRMLYATIYAVFPLFISAGVVSGLRQGFASWKKERRDIRVFFFYE